MKKTVLVALLFVLMCFVFSSCSKPENKEDVLMDAEKWNKMWELWSEGRAESPYAELMTYQSEVNNGGHDQYLSNLDNSDDITKQIFAVEQILPERLSGNLMKAYKAYCDLEENEDDENAEKTLERCDSVFYECENDIDKILIEYSFTVKP